MGIARRFCRLCDPRHHTITTVFIGNGIGNLKPADDAKRAGVFAENDLPEPIVFDHRKIIGDYFRYKKGASKKTIFSLKF